MTADSLDPRRHRRTRSTPQKAAAKTQEQLEREAKKKKAKAEKDAKFAAKQAAKQAALAAKANEPTKEKAEKKKKKEAKGPSPEDELALKDALNTEKGKKKNVTTVPMATSYNPVAVEAAWYDWWEEKKYFEATNGSDKPNLSS